MNTILGSARTVCTLVIAVLAAGCTAQSGTAFVPGASARNAPPTAAPNVGGSWMSPEAKRQNLVYVTNVNSNSVTVYGFSNHKLLGTLAGISQPFGACSDPSGNVWVVAWGNNKVYEFAHAAIKPTRVITDSDPSADLYACSVDPTTGNLAVTNWGPQNWYQGNVLVYPHGSGNPTAYVLPGLWFYFACTYDGSGNLYVDGLDSYLFGYFAVGELTKNGQARSIQLLPAINPKFIGGIQWDGQYLAIGNWQSLYEYLPDGSVAKFRRLTLLTVENWPVGLFSITSGSMGHHVIAPDTAGEPYAVQYWSYPKGGAPTATTKNGLHAPYAVTVSVAGR